MNTLEAANIVTRDMNTPNGISVNNLYFAGNISLEERDRVMSLKVKIACGATDEEIIELAEFILGAK